MRSRTSRPRSKSVRRALEILEANKQSEPILRYAMLFEAPEVSERAARLPTELLGGESGVRDGMAEVRGESAASAPAEQPAPPSTRR